MVSADVAQLVEHVIGNDEVSSSILLIGSKIKTPAMWRGSQRILLIFLEMKMPTPRETVENHVFAVSFDFKT